MHAPQIEIAKVFATVANDLAAQPDIDAVSDLAAHIATTVIACRWAQVVMLNERGSLTFRKPDDPTLEAVLRISGESGEGAVSEAVTGQETVLVRDFRTEQRWPTYTPRVIKETPIRSAFVHPLRLADVDLGALAMFSPTPSYFTETTCAAAALLAEHTAIAVATARSASRVHNLEIALTTNRRIGIAIGVLMARHHISDEAAFAMLRTASQHSHCKLRDVADYVSMTGELPPLDRTQPHDVSCVSEPPGVADVA